MCDRAFMVLRLCAGVVSESAREGEATEEGRGSPALESLLQTDEGVRPGTDRLGRQELAR